MTLPWTTRCTGPRCWAARGATGPRKVKAVIEPTASATEHVAKASLPTASLPTASLPAAVGKEERRLGRERYFIHISIRPAEGEGGLVRVAEWRFGGGVASLAEASTCSADREREVCRARVLYRR